MKNKKGQGLIGSLVSGVGGLIITVVIILVIVATLLGANLLTTGSEEANATDRLKDNFTSGIDQVSAKLPTIFLIGAVVLLFGVLVALVAQSRRMGIGAGGGSL